MGNRAPLTPNLYDYLLAVSLREPDVLRQLRDETARSSFASMQVPPEQGQFLGLLVQLMGARQTLEIGVFTGYSTLWTALSLPSNGCVVACDVSDDWTSVARRYWTQAGVAEKIDLRLGAALGTMDRLLEEPNAGSFDFVFIDADKENYDEYYERSLRLLRPGGMIAVDNVLWDGQVVNSTAQDSETRAIRALNEKIRNDERVILSMIPIADGLTLALKRA